MRRRVDNGYGAAVVVCDVDSVARGGHAKTTWAIANGDTCYSVGGGINHVHCVIGKVRDICEASIRREQDLFGPMPGNNDSSDDLIGCRINDLDGTLIRDASTMLMQDEKTVAIRRDSALSWYPIHRDGSSVRARHRV